MRAGSRHAPIGLTAVRRAVDIDEVLGGCPEARRSRPKVSRPVEFKADEPFERGDVQASSKC